MEPLGPILVVRAAALDESSPSDFARVDANQNTAQDITLSVGQFVRATIVSTSENSALARIGQGLVQLQLDDLPPPGSELDLQVITTAPQLQFRMVQSEDDIPAALDVALSPDLPQLVAAQSNPLSLVSARHAPAAWPEDVATGVAPNLSNQQLVNVFEQAVRELLSAAAPAGTTATGSALSTSDSQTLHASAQQAMQTAAPAQVAPDTRFLAYVGWAWPEQAIEVEVDQRGQNGATDEFMKTCVISLRLLLPKSGRLQSVLSWSTPGLRVTIDAGSADTADALRQTSGQFLDALAEHQVRVSGLAIRHD